MDSKQIIGYLKYIDNILEDGDKDRTHVNILKLVERIKKDERTISSRDKDKDKRSQVR